MALLSIFHFPLGAGSLQSVLHSHAGAALPGAEGYGGVSFLATERNRIDIDVHIAHVGPLAHIGNNASLHVLQGVDSL